MIHAIAGVASLVTAKMLGPRDDKKDAPRESSLTTALAGAGLLWMGWFGFVRCFGSRPADRCGCLPADRCVVACPPSRIPAT